MGQYEHLTISEREDIMCMRREGLSVREVARRLGRDGSTVSRELSRNSREGLYRASDAQAAADGRRLRCVRPRILDDPALGSLVQRLIRDERWSPEQVAGRVRLEGGTPGRLGRHHLPRGRRPQARPARARGHQARAALSGVI